MKQAINIILLFFIVLIDILLSARQSSKVVKSDESTKQQMNLRDYKRRPKLFARFNADDQLTNKWSRSSLTYSIESYPIQISEKNTKNIIREAFKAWTDHIPLNITEACSTCLSDFVINFAHGQYSDDFNFDGIGGILAQAYLPEDGQIIFDSDEIWTESFNDGNTNLFLVAVHTIGHALGLSHIMNEKSIMYPVYQLISKSNVISQPDRDAIQALYGKKQSTTRTPTTIQYPKTTSTRRPITTSKISIINPNGRSNIRCQTFLDAAFDHPDGTLHTIEEGVLWRYLSNEQKWEDQALVFSEVYPELSSPKQIVAGVYNSRKNQIFLFTNEHAYRYDIDNENRAEYVTEERLPRYLRNSILGAIYYLNDVYIIKRRTIRLYQADNGFQQSNERDLMEEFPRLQGTIKAAFSYNGLHHFFTNDDRVYVWDERLHTWQTKDKPMRTSWFACSDTETHRTDGYQRNQSPKQRGSQRYS